MNSRELVFCASTTDCSTARVVEKGTVFYCKKHTAEAQESSDTIQAGDRVLAKDRRNYGTVLSVEGSNATVLFESADRTTTTEVTLATRWLEKAESTAAR